METYVIRGLFLPGGMDDLARELGSAYTNWLFAPLTTKSIIKRHKAGELNGRVNIIGHSLGANAALRMANTLGEAGVPLGVVIMLDPTVEQTLYHGKGFAFQSSDFRAQEILGAMNISADHLNHMNMTTDEGILEFIHEKLAGVAV